MIERPTVLILGAGASAPYGFPVGDELLHDIDGLLRKSPDDEQSLPGYLRDLGYARDDQLDFARRLVCSGEPSVDAFLESNSKDEEIGKASIAFALMQKEHHQNLIDDAHHKAKQGAWYKYLRNVLRASREDLPRNQLSVVTYNYDRSLEEYLYRCFSNTYRGISVYDMFDLLERSIPIVHVHGQLGHHPYNRRKHEWETIRDYSPHIDMESLRIAMKQIKIAHEGADSDPEFKRAHELIAEAQIVCFLGFAYHSDNVTRLRLDTIDWDGKRIYACMFGMMGAVRERALGRLPRGIVTAGGRRMNALEFLRDPVELILLSTKKPRIPPTLPQASPRTHENVNIITALVLIAAITWVVAWGLSWPWWVALIAGVVVTLFVGHRLVPMITSPIIEAIERKVHSRR